MRKKWTDEQLIKAVAENTSMHATLEALGLKHSGSGYSRMRDYIMGPDNLPKRNWHEPTISMLKP